MVKSNQDSGSESHGVDVLKGMFPQFYDDVVDARDGEDFKDMST